MPKTSESAAPGARLSKTILRTNTASTVATWAGRFFLLTLLGYVLASIWSVFAAHDAGEVTGAIYTWVAVFTFMNPLALLISMGIGAFAGVPPAMAAACVAEMAAYLAVLAYWLGCKAACRKALEASNGDARAVDALAELLKHRKLRVRLAAARALARTGDYRAIQPLEALRKASAGGSKQAKAADRAITALQGGRDHAAQEDAETPEADVGLDRSAYSTAPFNSFSAGRGLIQAHGKPTEVLLRRDAATPALLEAVLSFSDGSKYALGGFSVGADGKRQEFLLKLLAEAGVQASAEQLVQMSIPKTIRS